MRNALTLLAVGLLFSSLLTSCDATFTPPLQAPLVSAPTFYSFPSVAPITVRSSVEPSGGQPPQPGGTMRIVVAWETITPGGVQGFTFFDSASLTAMMGKQDHFNYTLQLADSLPISAVRFDTIGGVPSVLAVGHVLLTDDPSIHDSLFVTKSDFFNMKTIYASTNGAMIVLRIGDPVIPRNDSSLAGNPVVAPNAYSKVVSWYDLSKNQLFIVPAKVDGFGHDDSFQINDDKYKGVSWRLITTWFWDK